MVIGLREVGPVDGVVVGGSLVTSFDQGLARYFFLIIDPNGKIIGESVIHEIDWDLRRANFHTCTGLNWTSFSFNLRAEKGYLRAGFKREGVLRDAVFDRGKYADTC